MKNKAGLFVLLAEIAVIVILHTARVTRPEAERPAATHQSQNNHFTLAQDQPGASITLK